VDYQLPQRFELEYIGADNKKHRPVMIHRAPFGSLERFVAVLIEYCAGNFPLWLSPDQVTVLTIYDRFNDYTQHEYDTLTEQDIRGLLDLRNEKITRKIRDAETRKVPYMLIVGEREASEQKVAVRRHGQGDQGSVLLDDFVKDFKEACAPPA